MPVLRVVHPSPLVGGMKGRKIFKRKRSTSNRNNCNLERVVKQSRFKNMKDYNKEQTADGVSASRPETFYLD